MFVAWLKAGLKAIAPDGSSPMAQRALADRQAAKTVVLIVGLGRDEAQPIHQQQEDDATIEYGAKIIQAASKEQDREIDQER